MALGRVLALVALIFFMKKHNTTTIAPSGLSYYPKFYENLAVDYENLPSEIFEKYFSVV